jgi:hypothetical protein
MTNEAQKQERIENFANGVIDYILMVSIGIGVMCAVQLDIKKIEKENSELRQTMSNLVQRVNYYYGTNWNYQPSGLKTNDVVNLRGDTK